MTRPFSAIDVARRINERFNDAAEDLNETTVQVSPHAILDSCKLLKETPDLDFAFLTAITAVDYIEYFELIYQLLSMSHNHSIIIKTRLYDRDEPTVSSVTSVWQGADLQEREIWDLMGVKFEGHPNLKRILLWEGFPGHPLRKDFIEQ